MSKDIQNQSASEEEHFPEQGEMDMPDYLLSIYGESLIDHLIKLGFSLDTIQKAMKQFAENPNSSYDCHLSNLKELLEELSKEYRSLTSTDLKSRFLSLLKRLSHSF